MGGVGGRSPRLGARHDLFPLDQGGLLELLASEGGDSFRLQWTEVASGPERRGLAPLAFKPERQGVRLTYKFQRHDRVAFKKVPCDTGEVLSVDLHSRFKRKQTAFFWLQEPYPTKEGRGEREGRRGEGKWGEGAQGLARAMEAGVRKHRAAGMAAAAGGCGAAGADGADGAAEPSPSSLEHVLLDVMASSVPSPLDAGEGLEAFPPMENEFFKTDFSGGRSRSRSDPGRDRDPFSWTAELDAQLDQDRAYAAEMGAAGGKGVGPPALPIHGAMGGGSAAVGASGKAAASEVGAGGNDAAAGEDAAFELLFELD